MTLPATIANLALWLDGTAPAWADTGGTVLTSAPAGRVRRVDQPSPLSGSWLAASDAVRPFREAAALDFHTGSNLALSAPAGTTLPGNACTIACSWVARDTNSPSAFGLLSDHQQFLIGGTDGGGNFGLDIFSNRLAFVYRNTLWDPFSGGSPVTPPGTRCAAVVRVQSTGIDLSYNFGGVTGTASLSASIAASTVNSLSVSTSNARLHAAVSQLIGYSRVVTDPERDSLLAWCVANQPESFPVAAPLVVIAGDSIARGWTLALREQGWPFLALPNLYATAPVRLNDTAISGWTLAQMQSDFAGSVQPLYSASRAKNILVVAGGTNSLYFGATAADTLSQYLAYCDTARAAGFRVVAHTILPRSGGATPGTFEADRQTVNAGIRAASGHYDALADTAAVSGMGAAGNETNATNYGDLTHPTAAGHALLEPTYRAAIIGLLAAVDPVIPTSPGLSSTLTYDQVTWHRPGVDELGGGAHHNVTRPRDPRTVLDARMFNQLVRQVVAQATLAPSARIQVEFPGGVPTVTAVAALNTALVPADFTITDNGDGDTSLTLTKWQGETLRPLELTIAEDVEIDRLRVISIASGWRVKTKLGTTGTDAAFVLALHAPAQH